MKDLDGIFEFKECDGGYILKSYLLKEDASVTNVEIPEKHNGLPIISIGREAFSEAEYLRSAKLPEGIKEIGESAFSCCASLKSVILPDSLKVIGASAFHICRKLKTVLFPSGIELIDGYAFELCKSIRSAILPSGLLKLGKGAFSDCSGLESVVFPEKLEYIGPFAFSRCKSLKSAVLPEKIKAVKDCLFEHCENLENIEFPDGLEEIGELAFVGCGLRSVKLPARLRRIGNGAFSDCAKLEKADFQDGNPSLWLSVFGHCPKLAAENVVQGLARSSDITKAFSDSNVFEWDAALRDDVFALAIKYDSFALFDKKKVLREMVKRDLSQSLPLTEAAGWNITVELMEELLKISLYNGFAETTAWLLDYKNRKMGFGEG